MTRVADTRALDAIAAALDGREWDADTLDGIAGLVRESGRLVRHPGDVPASYRITYEDFDYEPIDGEDAFYHDVNAARTAFANAVLSRPTGWPRSRSGPSGLTTSGTWSVAATS